MQKTACERGDLFAACVENRVGAKNVSIIFWRQEKAFKGRRRRDRGGGGAAAAAAFNRRPRVSFDSKVVSDFKSDKKSCQTTVEANFQRGLPLEDILKLR